MAEFINKYITYMLRPFEDTTVTGISVFPAFWNVTLVLTIAFTSLYYIVPYVLSKTSWYNELEPTKRKELPSYFISFVHHLYVVPFGWLHIYQDYLMVQDGGFIPNNHHAIKESAIVRYLVFNLLSRIFLIIYIHLITSKYIHVIIIIGFIWLCLYIL